MHSTKQASSLAHSFWFTLQYFWTLWHLYSIMNRRSISIHILCMTELAALPLLEIHQAAAPGTQVLNVLGKAEQSWLGHSGPPHLLQDLYLLSLSTNTHLPNFLGPGTCAISFNHALHLQCTTHGPSKGLKFQLYWVPPCENTVTSPQRLQL